MTARQAMSQSVCVCTESIVFESSHRKNARFKDVIMVCDASIRMMGGNG